MNSRIITIVTRRADGTFADKYSVAINPEIEGDLKEVKNFVYNYGMYGKASWFEIYEGTNLYFGDFRTKPFFTSKT